jgi:regulator of sigma E protease
MNILGYLVAVVFVGIVVFFHELGHFLCAKLVRCGVTRFILGWGPTLFSFRRKETTYGIAAGFIVGGYVVLSGGEEGEEVETETEEEVKVREQYGLKKFSALSAARKFLIFIGGVLVQFLLCVLIFTVIFAFKGKPVSRVVLQEISKDSPANRAGLMAGDMVLGIEGRNLSSEQDVINIVSPSAGKEMKFLIKRDGKEFTVTIVPQYNEREKRALIGVHLAAIPEYTREGMKTYEYITGGLTFTVDLGIKMVKGLWMIITGKIEFSKAAVGPVGIIEMTKEIVKTGILEAVIFFALINVNLAIINSLPFPAVDGGHVLILFIENLFKVRIKLRIKRAINYFGFSMIILFLIFVTYNDVLRLKDKYFGTSGHQVETESTPHETESPP